MNLQPVPIVGGCYADDTRPYSAQDCVNWIPERAEVQGGRSDGILRSAPGLGLFSQEGGNDPYSASVISLLHFNGDFSDETGLVYTILGTPTIETSQKKFGSSSMGRLSSVPGNYPYIIDTGASATASTPFTFEFFIYPLTLYTSSFPDWNRIFSLYQYGSLLYTRIAINGNNSMVNFSGDGSGSQAVVMNQWNHIALTSNGSSVRLYVNGLLSATRSAVAATNLGWSIGGAIGSNGDYHTAYFDEFRATVGYDRYPSEFSPPTIQFPNP